MHLVIVCADRVFLVGDPSVGIGHDAPSVDCGLEEHDPVFDRADSLHAVIEIVDLVPVPGGIDEKIRLRIHRQKIPVECGIIADRVGDYEFTAVDRNAV